MDRGGRGGEEEEEVGSRFLLVRFKFAWGAWLFQVQALLWSSLGWSMWWVCGFPGECTGLTGKVSSVVHCSRLLDVAGIHGFMDVVLERATGVHSRVRDSLF